LQVGEGTSKACQNGQGFSLLNWLKLKSEMPAFLAVAQIVQGQAEVEFGKGTGAEAVAIVKKLMLEVRQELEVIDEILGQ
jgi:hypothetical protein